MDFPRIDGHSQELVLLKRGCTYGENQSLFQVLSINFFPAVLFTPPPAYRQAGLMEKDSGGGTPRRFALRIKSKTRGQEASGQTKRTSTKGAPTFQLITFALLRNRAYF